jgi:hypothetical protein
MRPRIVYGDVKVVWFDGLYHQKKYDGKTLQTKVSV